jgi:hypothetical protein
MALIRRCVAQSRIYVAIARARPEKITVSQVRGNARGINGYLLEIGRVPGGKWQMVTLFPALAMPPIAAAHTNARAARHHRSCPEFFDPNMWAPPLKRLSNEC